ncbi:MAG: pantoate--beta-alanine ligase [Armatimonadetes bacterium]|nr:pantoate--beta-alanine ligase [Akkermansiaceae bacterium]
MWIAKTKSHLKKQLNDCSQPVILVPTMGALHLGHAGLIDMARQRAGKSGTVIVSIFVNAIQFDNAGDFEKYPRPFDADITVCQLHGVDGVFAPGHNEMYFPDRSITVTEELLSKGLCGDTRPGHFDGVCTVVLKLFNLTRCDAAVFGEKDFQQLAIIRRLVRDLDLDVEIILHPTIREIDGLAMSSRNVRLLSGHRKDAPRIRKALLAAGEMTSAQQILDTARQEIEKSPYLKIDYLTLVDAETLSPAANLNTPTILACAVYYDDVRLIDHIGIRR